METWIGVDVSKLKLDLAWLCENKPVHMVVQNNLKGFEKILEKVPVGAHFVMEATGYYFFNLAIFLFEKGIHVSVENPIKVKHHMRMNLLRTKTDKADAISIAKYGEIFRPQKWEAPSAQITELKHLTSMLEMQKKQRTQWSNYKESLASCCITTKRVSDEIDNMHDHLTAEITRLEKQIQAVGSLIFAEEIELLTSIPCIGKNTAILFLSEVSGDINRFASSRNLLSYFGLCPSLRESGSSIRGRGSICKMGGQKMRRQLYMCAMTAMFRNPGCKQMNLRLREKGKAGKVVMVAIMAKLVRQMYGVLKKRELFNPQLALGG